MKKHFLKSLLAIACLLCCIGVYAHDFEVDSIYYNKLSSTEVAVTYKGFFFLDYSNEYTGSVVIPERVTYSGTTYSVTSIGDYAFYGCKGLTEVTIGNSVTSIGEWAFSHCAGLTEITIPEGVTSIGENAFSYCHGLTEVTIGNSVTSIGSNAFAGCTGLTEIAIPEGVTSIGDEAFYECSGLTSIVVDKDNKTYDSRDNCNAIIETATNTLIAGCKNSFIPNSVTSIGDYAFYGCKGLTEATIPNSVTSIGDNVFCSCTGLTEITIPNSITSIGDYAFYNCSGLKEITIPNSVSSIGEGAFAICSGLTSIVVDKDNKTYDSRDNCNAIIETATNTLIAGCKNSFIPNSVTSIGDDAFEVCTGLTEITIPNSVTSIGDYAFHGCTGMTELTIPNSVVTIGEWAFAYCSGLTEICIKANTPPTIDSFTFYDVDESIPVYVPAGSVEAYKNDQYWNKFNNILSLPEAGLYFGITAFNSKLYKSGIQLLNESSKSEFTNFIDNRTTDNGTILYYAVDKTIEDIEKAKLPEEIKSVAIITFTDGLDLGSLRQENMEDIYDSKSDYLDAVHNRIKNTKIKGNDIVSYSIGLRGNDVGSSEDQIAEFRQNIEKIASKTGNVMEVNDMDEVSERFEEITNQLFTFSYKQTLKLSTVEDVSRKMRFTFDDVDANSVSRSQIYIEGDFISRERKLTNVVYEGLTSSSGATVQGENEGISTVFTFNDILHETGMYYVPIDNIQRWYMTSSGMWQRDSEFSPENSAKPSIEKNSAVVMLVMDCSNSLVNDISKLKTTAKTFIENLSKGTKTEINNLPYFDPDKSIKLTYNVTVPEGTPDCYISGEMNNWGYTPMNKVDDTHYTITLENVRCNMEYKYYYGQNSNNVELNADDTPLTENRTWEKEDVVEKWSTSSMADSLTLNYYNLTAIVGETYVFTATIYPDDVTEKAVVWSVSDERVVGVEPIDSLNATVTILKEGTASITAMTIDGSELTATCDIDVVSAINQTMLDSTDAEYYTIDGMKLAKKPSRGIYIVKQGSTVKKVVL